MILAPLFPLLFPTTNLAANEVRQLIKELSGAKAKFTSASDSDFEQLKNSVKSDHDKIQKIFSTLIQENDADLLEIKNRRKPIAPPAPAVDPLASASSFIEDVSTTDGGAKLTGSLEHGGSIEVRGKGNLPPIVIKLPSFEEAKAKAEAKLAQLIAGGKDPLEIDPMTYDPPAPLKKFEYKPIHMMDYYNGPPLDNQHETTSSSLMEEELVGKKVNITLPNWMSDVAKWADNVKAKAISTVKSVMPNSSSPPVSSGEDAGTKKSDEGDINSPAAAASLAQTNGDELPFQPGADWRPRLLSDREIIEAARQADPVIPMLVATGDAKSPFKVVEKLGSEMGVTGATDPTLPSTSDDTPSSLAELTSASGRHHHIRRHRQRRQRHSNHEQQQQRESEQHESEQGGEDYEDGNLNSDNNILDEHDTAPAVHKSSAHSSFLSKFKPITFDQNKFDRDFEKAWSNSGIISLTEREKHNSEDGSSEGEGGSAAENSELSYDKSNDDEGDEDSADNSSSSAAAAASSYLQVDSNEQESLDERLQHDLTLFNEKHPLEALKDPKVTAEKLLNKWQSPSFLQMQLNQDKNNNPFDKLNDISQLVKAIELDRTHRRKRLAEMEEMRSKGQDPGLYADDGYTGSFVNLLGADGSNKNIKKLSLAEINENKHLHEVMAKANQGTRRIEDAFKKMSEEFAVLKKRLDKVVDESPLKPKA